MYRKDTLYIIGGIHVVVGNLNCVLYILAEACGLGSKGI